MCFKCYELINRGAFTPPLGDLNMYPPNVPAVEVGFNWAVVIGYGRKALKNKGLQGENRLYWMVLDR